MTRAVREHIGQRYRFAHVVRVARLSAQLAAVHGVVPGRARLAGMLHDLARLYPAQELLDGCAARAMTIDAFERANPIVLHARLGAALAAERFGVDDAGVLSAIRKHTLADAVMTPLDAVVYLADALEPGRTFAGREALVALAFRDLDGAMRAVVASSAGYLQSRGLAVAPQTVAAALAYGVPTAAYQPPAPPEEKATA